MVIPLRSIDMIKILMIIVAVMALSCSGKDDGRDPVPDRKKKGKVEKKVDMKTKAVPAMKPVVKKSTPEMKPQAKITPKPVKK